MRNRLLTETDLARLRIGGFLLLVVSDEELHFRARAGVDITMCGYKPYQIETEYRRNIAAGLEAPAVHCFAGVRYDSIRVLHTL